MNSSKEALIALNIAREQPGSVLDVLQDRGWKPTIINLEAGEVFPSPKKYGALIVMGGPPSAKDTTKETPWMPHEITRIQEALAENVPYLGVCLGMQALAYAAGGEIIKSPRKEVGFREAYNPPGQFYSLRLTEEGKKDPLFRGLGETLPVFHLHGEAVHLTSAMKPEAQLLATADVVPNQVIKVGERAYGTQGHFELTPQLLENWLQVDPDLLALGTQGIEQLRADFQEKQKEYTKTAKTIFNNFLDLLA
jgi:GMP synthase (glutamine-hydrolysing)